MTAQDVQKIISASFRTLGEADDNHPSSGWKKKQFFKFNKDGKMTSKNVGVAGYNEAKDAADKIQKNNRQFDSNFNETLYFKNSNGSMRYKVQLNLKPDKSFNYNIYEIRTTPKGGD